MPDEIRCSSLIVEDPKNPTGPKVTITARGETAGIWLGDDSNCNSVAIYMNPSHTAIGVYGDLGKQKGLAAALSVDKTGAPSLQFVGLDGQITILSIEEIRHLQASTRVNTKG